MKKIVVVGSGFSGATCARVLAENGFMVEVIEKKSHIGGSAYDYTEAGIIVQKYGPHIFHTNDKKVFEFLSRFTKWFKYEHTVRANIFGKLVPVPFNFESIDICFDEKTARSLKNKLQTLYPNKDKVLITELLKTSDDEVRMLGEYVLENIFKTYSQKQWGEPIEKIDPTVINRVPINLNYDNKYFADTYQLQPSKGYTALIKNILDHENITVRLNTSANDVVKLVGLKTLYDGVEFAGAVIVTSPVDEFFDYRFGELPFRSVKFELETHNFPNFQDFAVINYTVSEDFVRISEFNKFTSLSCNSKKTIIMKEFPLDYQPKSDMDAYYPINKDENVAKFFKYENYAKLFFPNIYLLGRTGNYKYINMDKAVELAIEKAEEVAQKSCDEENEVAKQKADLMKNL